MSHLDEGQLHALLDGELSETERRAAEAHLEDCGECRRSLLEARELLAGADELIAAVEVPPAAAGGAARTGAPARRRFPWRSLAWAASLVAAVGLGWTARADLYRAAPEANLRSQLDENPVTQGLATPASDSTLQPAGPKDDGKTQVLDKAKVSAARPATPPPAPAPDLAAKRVVEPKAPEQSQDALRALTNTAPTDDQRRNEVAAAGQLADRDPTADRPVTEERKAEPKEVEPGRLGAAAAGEREAVRNYLPAQPSAAPAPASAALQRRRDRQVGAFQTTPMDTAVRILGGSIRLVDGMTPARVLVGSGGSLPGYDPSREVVRVVYIDPPGRELWLDQQRPDDRAREGDAAGLEATTLLPGDTLAGRGAGGARSLSWVHQTGFRLVLTGFLPADSLRVLARRVQ
jgi:hypothetical protein